MVASDGPIGGGSLSRRLMVLLPSDFTLLLGGQGKLLVSARKFSDIVSHDLALEMALRDLGVATHQRIALGRLLPVKQSVQIRRITLQISGQLSHRFNRSLIESGALKTAGLSVEVEKARCDGRAERH